MARREGSLRVEVPKPGEDKPRFGRVLVITLAGFAIGIAWPRLAGMKLVPGVPEESNAQAEAPAGDSAEPKNDAPPALGKAAPAGDDTEPPPATKVERLKISEPKITSCRDEGGTRHTTCDSIDIDGAVRPKLLALEGCPALETAQGSLSLGLELDFESKKVTDVLKGKSTTVPDAVATELISCAKKEFTTLGLADVKTHQHAGYTLFYIIEILPPGAKPEAGDAGTSVTPASGRATVTWEVAIIRDQPNQKGESVARIMRGTRVVVTGRDGDWYRVKYDAKGTEGWVFRTAIGM
jgi:hypothetical protein